MKCNEIRELMPDLAAGLSTTTSEMKIHLDSCAECAGKLEAFRQTMSLLDEWQTPEPSPYFDVRLQARLREEMAKPQAGWLHWFRRPVLAAALTVIMGVGIGLFFTRGNGPVPPGPPVAEVGSAVSDLQTLEKNDDMYAKFELLDDLDLQQDVVDNSQNAD